MPRNRIQKFETHTDDAYEHLARRARMSEQSKPFGYIGRLSLLSEEHGFISNSGFISDGQSAVSIEPAYDSEPKTIPEGGPVRLDVHIERT